MTFLQSDFSLQALPYVSLLATSYTPLFFKTGLGVGISDLIPTTNTVFLNIKSMSSNMITAAKTICPACGINVPILLNERSITLMQDIK